MAVDAIGKSQFASWRVPNFSRAIECPPEVMEEIRAFACDEFLHHARAGQDAGGVLFGTRRDDLIRILTWRPIACEARGATLQLSLNERMNLAVQLEMARKNPDLKDLRPLGWFVSHPYGVALSESDVELFNGFFPESWQVTLVLQPQGTGRAQAAFFVRDASGKTPQQAQGAFELEAFAIRVKVRTDPDPPPPAVQPVAQPAVQPAPKIEPAPEAPVPAQSVVEPAAKIETPPAPEPPVVQPAAKVEAAPPISAPEPAPPPAPPPTPKVEQARFKEPVKLTPRLAEIPAQPLPAPSLLPSFELDEGPAMRERWLWAIPIVLALSIAGVLLYQRSPSAARAIGLHASNEAQTVQFVWDANSPVVRDAHRGELEISDAGKSATIPLTSDQLHAGKMSYLPQSSEVSVVITVYPSSGDPIHDSTTLVAPMFPLSTEPPQLLPESKDESKGDATGRDALQNQVRQLRDDLAKERAHTTEQQNLIRILEDRLGIKPDETKAQR